ncbi:methyl-accepting chemotaxis protein [Cognatilysobacter bugurensis]|uniref:Methyl-accepting chemotaxis protein n=1 Tax=Cognatilysobacter bugurensis TaxID=543356 RepID=A0A918W9I5_9GAMM|nr:methyl-accepting chemotaxis protein [Lysobacter bugurensis]GHA90365.1 methyl-accepting chemotaxis protein [Lysobacter bugurensis]
MTTFSKLRPAGLQAKLLGALCAGLALVLLCALSGLAFGWRSLASELPPEVELAAQSATISQEFSTQVQEWKNVLIRGHDAEQRDKYLKAFNAQHAKVQALSTEQAGRIRDPETAALAETFARQHLELHGRYLEGFAAFEAAGHVTAAGDAAVKGIDREPTATLRKLVDRNQALADEAVLERSRQAQQGLVLAAALTLALAIALVTAIGLWLRRAVLRPIHAVVDAARMVSRGELEVNIDLRSRDEIEVLGRAMSQVAQTLREVSAAQTRMAERHQAGQMSYRIPDEAFEGAYRAMVSNTNALVGSQTALIESMLATVQAYARGDLASDMPRLPGEKAAITDALDTAKRNLGAINAEIRRLVEGAAAGDFSLRGTEGAFEHDFRAMVVGLNALMAGTEDSLAQVSAVLRSIAAGELGARMDGVHRGVFAQIQNDATTTLETLGRIVAEIRQSSDSINSAAGEIASGNSDLSQRTEQQAAALEETTSSMEELTATVKQNAENARRARDLSSQAADVATQGERVVSSVVTTMADIDAASRKVADIISVIDGIAFQTNILALNAAVEAARAGEQGRGFAVVAAEVRSLAQRSANAAKEIKQLIADSTVKTVQGNELVQRAGKTMSEVLTSVRSVSELVSGISAASAEQTAGIEQVNQAITHMDEGTQQNAALVEEASASARALEQQAEQLVQTVAVFRLAQQAQAAGPTVAKAAAKAAPARRPAPAPPMRALPLH